MQTIKKGSRGQPVQMLQLALVRAGYGSLTIDGVFGSRTDAAVRDFQGKNGLQTDGIAGPRTWAALEKYITGYVRHTVSAGDTFYKLAATYSTTVSAIQTANPTVVPTNLRIGSTLTVPLGFSVTPANIGYSSELNRMVCEGLVMRYPFMRIRRVGTSVLGTPLLCLYMGSGRKSVFYNASHHANEWITTPVVTKYMEDYAKAYATGGRIGGASAAELFRSGILYVVPMVNPDGVDLVNGVLDTNSSAYRRARQYAANYPSIPFPSGWKANIAGVDLNLNYPADWEKAKAAKYALGFTSPAPRDYVGPKPLSEPESLAMYSLTRSSSFALTVSYHTQGEEIYWKFSTYEPQGSRAIGERMAAVSGYRLALTPPAADFAGYKDWFIQTYNRPGYTVEAGRGTNPLPISEFPEIYADNTGIMTVGLTSAFLPRLATTE